MPLIAVHQLKKAYLVPEREAGLLASLGALGKRRTRTITAVSDLTFEIAAGEMVALLGPNGAGKTTTLKMLSGLLQPTAGEITVAGYRPYERNHAYLRQISMVLGNKTQMRWDIPPLDTFSVLRKIYGVPLAQFQETLDELVDLLVMESLLHKPVRNLSLGERMKCELVAALLHRPRLLFLDEPTLGLDVTMQRRLRSSLTTYNQRHNVTVILTSHYMADVVALCKRVILINDGRLVYDRLLSDLAERLVPYKLIRVIPPLEIIGGTVVEQTNEALTLRVHRHDAPHIAAQLLQNTALADLSIQDPPIEVVIDQLFTGGIV
ncbi:MAG: ATP-binding cassette domain-containing protein [Chloroflexi bacterium AL-W]|nr:ATP-binding cassette domain-containing protein [Chloroflexi bacterium AL-N1]NOK66854.1 ATP-binding cassette domain-containing protein [Chloroflexi bacterium AL-N10]NOK74854.1 ATP-binding cassette domain-containing protein [Chloroflexi bacterium AL-N5]NOK81457.1 ATP-binding cassette domain-containing protein [Chloroflexi bacterium AL-W]NOK88926.1 ATP-binding cassette domain-containing protein [Chloroflexi bacterium AL-N15]